LELEVGLGVISETAYLSISVHLFKDKPNKRVMNPKQCSLATDKKENMEEKTDLITYLKIFVSQNLLPARVIRRK